MQNRSYATPNIVSAKKPTISRVSPSPTQEELTRIFNTALVSSQAGAQRDYSAELCELTESAPFKAILNAVSQLARVQGVDERQAAEQVIQTFRKMDEIWGEYVSREGMNRLRGSRN